jgi:uncharacterized protein (TIGR03435 family)
MSDWDDHDLLAQYARGTRDRAEAAFAALAERHLNLVYSTALRSVGNAHAAEEISQAVFLILADKADKLSRRVVLPGWLYQTTRLTAANFLRGEIRRQKREQEAFMHSSLNEPANETWTRIAPVLDDALARLGARDRDAIVLRFFENKSLREVGAALGASEDAAKMRVNRALEKLRKMFARRGATFSAAAIAGAISTNSVHAAPAGLAKMISAVAMTKGAAAGGSTLALVKGALKLMAWSKAKTAVVTTAIVLLGAGTTTVVVEKIAHPKLTADNLSWADDPKYWTTDSRVLEKIPAGVFIFRPTKFANSGGAVWANGRMSGKNFSVGDLVDNAYGFSYTRTVFPADMPRAHFDVMSTMAGGSSELLKNELKKRFGLTAHPEKRNADVLLLRVQNPNPPNLKRHQQGDSNSSWFGGNGKITIKNNDLGGFFSDVEGRMGAPVINQTGITGRYDLELDWRPKPGETEKDAYRRALLEQLGLELVPANMPMEMLIVEKAP